MMCPKCKFVETKVVDSRQCNGKSAWSKYIKEGLVKRRRECQFCGHRFTTVEMPVREET